MSTQAGMREATVGLYSARPETAAAIDRIRQRISQSSTHPEAQDSDRAHSTRASSANTVIALGGALKGEDKYLGAAVGDDGNVYGIPGSAKVILKINLHTSPPEVTEIGDCRGNFVGNALSKKQFKWLRGLTAADPVFGEGAAIYGIPANAEGVLKVVPRTQEVTILRDYIGADGEKHENPKLEGRWKYHGAAIGRDGNIYCIPANALRVMMIVPTTGEVRLVGPPLLEGVGQKWYGGIPGNDGCIYGMPFNADCVLKIEPRVLPDGTLDPIISTFGSVPLDGWKWHGGLAGHDGMIYAIPSHADRVLEVNPVTQVLREVGSLIESGPVFDPSPRYNEIDGQSNKRWKGTGKYKYGGAVLGPDHCVYALPYDAHKVLKIVPQSVSNKGETEVVALELPTDPDCLADFACHNKWQNGYVGRDGCIYAIPVSAPAVLRIDPRSGEVDTVGRDVCEGYLREKWEGGVQGPDGALYCVPQASKFVLRIDPPAL